MAQDSHHLLTPDPIAFARECGDPGPCARYVALWLTEKGVPGAPRLRTILRDWRRMGVEAAVAHWCERMGLLPCAAAPGAVALVTQPAGDPVFGVLASQEVFVTRSFSRVLIVKNPQIIKAWRV